MGKAPRPCREATLIYSRASTIGYTGLRMLTKELHPKRSVLVRGIKVSEESTPTPQPVNVKPGDITPIEEKHKHAGGRPTKYRDDMPGRVLSFIDECEASETVQLPTVEGIALTLDVATSTVELWGQVHEEFSGTLKKAKQTQKNMLMNNGLSGDYNSTIAKLILSANHGMHEKSERNIGVPETLAAALAALAALAKSRNEPPMIPHNELKDRV